LSRKRVCRFFANFFIRIFRGKKHVELEKFKSNLVYKTNIEYYLNEFQKPGVKHELSLKDFSLYYFYGLHQTTFDGVYSDAPYVLVLTHKSVANEDVGIACVGFEVVTQSTILIKQIQGVRGMAPFLQSFRWEKMLLETVTDWAKKASFKSVRVIQGKDSYWHNERLDKDFFMKYDVTARRSGFKFDEKDKTYVRTLA